MSRHVVLFARDPGRESREKGLGAAGEDLFEAFGLGWLEAARQQGASLILATPPEDRASWRGRLGPAADVSWIDQRGSSFGERLAGVARRAAERFGYALIVGGDVPPSGETLREAFSALEQGAQAVLAPSRDGGVSLLALGARDIDLLLSLAPRQRGVVATLERRLRARGRATVRIAEAPDVDGRRSLTSLLWTALSAALRPLVRRALADSNREAPQRLAPLRARKLAHPLGLRAPPAFA